MRAFVSREKGAMPLAVALATLFVATAATGQGVGGIVESLQGSGGRDAALDPRAEEQAIEMARGSFERTVKKAGEEILASQENVSSETTARVESLVSESVDGFLFEVHDELMDAKGDGLLTQSELSEEIQEAREFILEDLRGALQAAIDGASRPPTYEESEGAGDYTLSMTRYIAFERNAPRVWAILAMWIIGAVLCAFAISRFSERFAGRTKGIGWITGPLATAREPLLLIAFAIGLSAGRSWIWLPVFVEDAVAMLVRMLVFGGALWTWWRVSGRIARGIAQMFTSPGSHRNEAADVSRKTLRLLGLGIFLLVVAESVLDTDLTALLAGVGVLGIAASLGAQDTLRNLIGSVTIHGDRPFVPGDLVRFQGRIGTIEEVGFRSTRMRELDGPVLVIPNAELIRESVTNLSARTYIRHHYAIDLEYGTAPERMREGVAILEEILEARDHPEGQGPHVTFDSYGSYNLRIELWYTSNTGDYFEAKRERGEVNLEILARFGEAGLDFAFPTRTLYIEGEREEDDPPASDSERTPGEETPPGSEKDPGGGRDAEGDPEPDDEADRT